ncbi:glycerophosphodiester phosphodiesterase [Gramella sp. GC03-9]|uniref:Glycerophosphodiester phosphodiesterase n=1 Tax=Christiangramia oceanisediminis TaxID=2920386 RepID=A0A9X2KZL3_9FLAO|nr:glycerophosphodiester phosphodiesterase family protein [Gramella oceanisediminis]MCP9201283.1 glycerophosphodiester phosphodiesterase [Gramella oceanisediminis]
MIKFFLLSFLFLVFSCKKNHERASEAYSGEQEIEIHGHRGSRGTMPENTIQGFIAAINDSADVLEMDVVISNDKKVVVSHEAYMASKFVLLPNGNIIQPKDERKFNLYEMSYDSIQKFETGLKEDQGFPDQKKISTYKPLLSEVIDSVEEYIRNNEIAPVRYNIEIKSDPRDYKEYQPEPEEFVELVMKLIQSKNIENRYSIQSFDTNILEILNEKYPKVPLVYLVYKPGISNNLEQLSFVPDIYSPEYNLITTKAFVDTVKRKNMKLIPWTVNDSLAIKRMKSFGVDGIISDYPNRVYNLLQNDISKKN